MSGFQSGAFQSDAFQQDAGATTDVSSAGAIASSTLFGTTVVTAEGVTQVTVTGIAPADLYGTSVVTTTAVTDLQAEGIAPALEFGGATVTAEGVTNLSVEGIAPADLYGEPTVTTSVVAETAPEGAGRRRRWIVEIDGRDVLADSLETVKALLEENRKVTPLPTKRKRTTRVVTLPEVRLEGMPAFRIEGESVARKIQAGMNETDLRAVLEALLEEDDLEVLLLAA